MLTASSLLGPDANAQATASPGACRSLTVDRIVAATADQVWNVLHSGDDVDEWFPVIATCKSDGTVRRSAVWYEKRLRALGPELPCRTDQSSGVGS